VYLFVCILFKPFHLMREGASNNNVPPENDQSYIVVS
jgi:hypothetical protein